MQIRTTVIVIVSISIVLLASLLAAVNGSLTIRRFHQLEQEQALEQIGRLQDTLNQDIANLVSKLSDWSSWDDTWKFMGGENPTFPTTQVTDSAFTGNNVDAMLFIDGHGKLVHRGVPSPTAVSVAGRPELQALILATPALRPSVADATPIAGLLEIQGELVLYAARPILQSSGTGESHGTLVWIRDLDQDERERLAKRIHSTIEIKPEAKCGSDVAVDLASSGVELHDDNRIEAYRRIKDCLGQPNIVIGIALERTIWHAGITTLIWQVLSTGLVLLLVGVTVVALLERMVIGRLISLARQVNDAEQRAVPIIVHGHDEIARLATAVEALRGHLAKARDEAMQTAKTKADFLAVMSHEIRTPLNGVIGMSGLLARTKLTSEQEEYTAVIRSSADNLLLLLNDILDFSKIEAGKIELERVPYRIGAVFGDAVTLLAEKAQAKQVELVLAFAPDLPAGVIGDPGRLRQVIINLVSNAVKFTERGTVVVRVGLRISDGRHFLDVAVEDSGIGMDEATLARLFSAFTQADASTTRRFGGTGLGLAISKRLVELMGGTITVTSQPGHGSIFKFSVMVQPDPEALALESPLHPGMTALIAVADGPLSEWLVAMAQYWRAELKGAVDYAELLIASSDAAPDVVIIDRDLPGLQSTPDSDPFEPIRLAWPNVPMVVLAPLYRRDSIPGTVVITKPVRPDRLYAAIADARAGRVTQAEAETAPAVQLAGRVLVVDDHPINRRLACVLLERMGITAVTAENGLDALACLAVTPVDAVLMDCQMPVMDGFAATAEIRRLEQATGRHVFVVALTANAFSEDRTRCLAAGMDDFLTKPLRDGDLQRMLAPHLPIAAQVPETAHQVVPDSEVPAIPMIDPTTLAMLRDLPGDTPGLSLFAELGRVFLSEFTQRFEGLVSAMMSDDPAGSAQQAHAIKGSCMTLGLQPLGKLMEQIEHAARQGDLASGVEMMGSVQETWEQTRTELLASVGGDSA